MRAPPIMPAVCVTRIGQSGRSLVELMVSITVSMLLVAGVASAYLGATQTARVSTQLAAMTDNGQIVMQLIGGSIRQASYGEIVGSSVPLGAANNTLLQTDTLFGAGPSVIGCTGGGFVDDTAANPACGAAGDANFDTLMVRYQGDAVVAPQQGRLDDCLGRQVPLEPLPAGHVGWAAVPNGRRPMVQNAYFGGNGALWCRGNGRPTADAAFAPAEQLVSNVEQFKVFYGFDDVRWADPSAAAASTVRSLRDATFLNAQDPVTRPWDYVVSVHICMLIRSGQDGLRRATADATRPYVRCPQNAAEAAGEPPTTSASDGVVRRAYTRVFSVRAHGSGNPLQFIP